MVQGNFTKTWHLNTGRKDEYGLAGLAGEVRSSQGKAWRYEMGHLDGTNCSCLARGGMEAGEVAPISISCQCPPGRQLLRTPSAHQSVFLDPLLYPKPYASH